MQHRIRNMQCVAQGWKFLFLSLSFRLNFHFPVQFIQNAHRNYGETTLRGPSLGERVETPSVTVHCDSPGGASP